MPAGPAPPRGGPAFRRLLRDPMGALGVALVALVVSGAVLAGGLTGTDPTTLDLPARHQGPSWTHPLGTDHLGRDLFARVLYGGQVALKVSGVSVGLALAVGLLLGMLAGYGPPWLDHTLVLAFDAVRSFPTIMFALALVTLLGPSILTIVVIVVVTSFPVYGRIVRTQTQSLKTHEFVLAERAMGARLVRVLGRHILPNVVGPVLIL